MIWKLGLLPLTPPPLHLLCKRKLHNKIKPPYVRLSSSWHKGRFKHVCLHFQNNLNCLQVCIGGRAKNILSIYLKIHFYTFPPWFVAMECCLCMICGQRWKPDIWTGGDKKTKSNPLWMVVDYLDLVTGAAQSYHSIGPQLRVHLSYCDTPVNLCQLNQILPTHKSNHFQMEWQKANKLIIHCSHSDDQGFNTECWLNIGAMLIFSNLG